MDDKSQYNILKCYRLLTKLPFSIANRNLDELNFSKSFISDITKENGERLINQVIGPLYGAGINFKILIGYIDASILDDFDIHRIDDINNLEQFSDFRTVVIELLDETYDECVSSLLVNTISEFAVLRNLGFNRYLIEIFDEKERRNV